MVSETRPPTGEPDLGGALTPEWRRWTATTLLEGTPLVDVLSVLSQNGIPRSESVPFCARLYDDPVFQAGQKVAGRLHKIESVLTMRDTMRHLSDVPASVERRSGLAREEFLDEYYAPNRPVIMTDVCGDWPAVATWTPSELAHKVGAVEVEVMSGRASDPLYEINSEQHKFLMPFDEYVAKVESTDKSNDLYLVANNKLLASPAAAALWEDFRHDDRFLKPDPSHSQAFLWFGPGGTVTPLHHDTVNVLFNQIRGAKRFILIPALAIHRMYNNLAVYSEVDPLSPDLERYPLFAGADQILFDVGPGDTLFIPAGWWHHVESLDTSISVSFTNFVYDNHIDWAHPTD